MQQMLKYYKSADAGPDVSDYGDWGAGASIPGHRVSVWRGVHGDQTVGVDRPEGEKTSMEERRARVKTFFCIKESQKQEVDTVYKLYQGKLSSSWEQNLRGSEKMFG